RPHLLWDGLPVFLRCWVAGDVSPRTVEAWLLPSQISGRSPIGNTRSVVARIDIGPVARLTLGAAVVDAQKVEVSTPFGRDAFWFESAFPHPLLKMETSWGRKLERTRIFRLDYWNHHMNGDEKVLTERAPSR